MMPSDSLAQQFEAQVSAETRSNIKRLFDQRKVRPQGALYMAEQAGEDVTGLTRLHVAAWLCTQ